MTNNELIQFPYVMEEGVVHFFGNTTNRYLRMGPRMREFWAPHSFTLAPARSAGVRAKFVDGSFLPKF